MGVRAPSKVITSARRDRCRCPTSANREPSCSIRTCRAASTPNVSSTMRGSSIRRSFQLRFLKAMRIARKPLERLGDTSMESSSSSCPLPTPPDVMSSPISRTLQGPSMQNASSIPTWDTQGSPRMTRLSILCLNESRSASSSASICLTVKERVV